MRKTNKAILVHHAVLASRLDRCLPCTGELRLGVSLDFRRGLDDPNCCRHCSVLSPSAPMYVTTRSGRQQQTARLDAITSEPKAGRGVTEKSEAEQGAPNQTNAAANNKRRVKRIGPAPQDLSIP